MMSGLFLCLCIVLFRMGVFGTFQNRRNFQIMLQCIEVILLSVNLIFLTGSVTLDDMNGQLMALWVLTAAAAETAQGQALCVQYFRLRSTLDVEMMSLMKGLSPFSMVFIVPPTPFFFFEKFQKRHAFESFVSVFQNFVFVQFFSKKSMFLHTHRMIRYLLLMIRATAVPLLLAVAFLTLVERRVMGRMQRRQGPNVWGFFGVLQPFLDGQKLQLKEPILPRSADQPQYLWAPVLTFLTSQIRWAAQPTTSAGAISDLSLGTMYVLAIGSVGVYGIQLAGWSRNSKYAFQGCCRSIAQMISYELPMGLIVLTRCLITNSLNWSVLVYSQQNGFFCFAQLPLRILWIICCQAELNRAPMDLPERERELVAGYNVEYRSMGFALFFIAEYRNMILMRTMTRLLFFGGGISPIPFQNFQPYSFWLSVKRTRIVFLYIWIRATLPRFKYNQLMSLGWKRLLPLTLAGFVRNAVFVFCIQIISNFSKFSFFCFSAKRERKRDKEVSPKGRVRIVQWLEH